jgi:hypothetical protein
LQVAGHLQSSVVLGNELGVAVLQLNELSLKLGIAQQRVGVVRRVVNNPKSELRRSSSNAQPHDEQKCRGFSFHLLFSSLSFTDVATLPELKKRFDEYLDLLSKGKEPKKVRVIIE